MEMEVTKSHFSHRRQHASVTKQAQYPNALLLLIYEQPQSGVDVAGSGGVRGSICVYRLSELELILNTNKF
jgi:hypothetical protein